MNKPPAKAISAATGLRFYIYDAPEFYFVGIARSLAITRGEKAEPLLARKVVLLVTVMKGESRDWHVSNVQPYAFDECGIVRSDLVRAGILSKLDDVAIADEVIKHGLSDDLTAKRWQSAHKTTAITSIIEGKLSSRSWRAKLLRQKA